MTTTKRLYFYGVSFAALLVTAFGVALLLGDLLDVVLGRNLLSGERVQISIGIAMVIVGGPLWLIHWGLARRQLEAHPEEAESSLRKLYAYAVLLLAALIALHAARLLLNTVLRVDDFSANWTAQLVVWGGVWGFHWMQERREGQPSSGGMTLRRWYVYGVSVYALLILTLGGNGVLNVLFQRVYDGFFGEAGTLVAGPDLWDESMRKSIASIVVGGAWWVVHWIAFTRGDHESTLRQVYLYLFAFLGGSLASLAALAAIVFATMQWLLSAPGLSPGVQHFRVVPVALASLFVGFGLLGYHWAVIREESGLLAGRLPGARRSFDYIVSALGLAMLVGGAVSLIGGLVYFILATADEPFTEIGAWRTPLAAALTLLFIGAPIWFTYWFRVQKRVLTENPEERSSRPRRIHIYGVLGVLALGALGSLVSLLAIVIEELLEGSFSLEILRRSNWLLAVSLTAGTFLVYYWQVLREDQRAGAEAGSTRKRVTLALGEGSDETVQQLEIALDTRIRVLRIVPSETTIATASLTDADIQELTRQVYGAPTDQVLVVLDGAQFQIYSYH